MKKILIAVTAAAGLLLAGCGTDKAMEQFNDAPRGASNNGTADVISFPDGFSSVSTKCDHGNRVYVIFHGDSPYGSVAVVANDPTCSS